MQRHMGESTEDRSFDGSSEGESAKSEPGLYSLLNRFFLFLANANKSTLSSIIGGSIAFLYILVGKPAVLLIGIVGGVILHAWWEELGHDGESSRESMAKQKRQESSITVAKRLLDWQEIRSIHAVHDESTLEMAAASSADYSEFQLTTRVALNTLTEAIISDYVRWWYEPILPCELEFPLTCRNVLIRFAHSVSSHVARKRPADIFLQFATNSSSLIIVFLNELSTALGPTTTSTAPVADSVHRYLEQYPDSSLANVLSADQQEKKLSLVAADLLATFLEPKVYECEPLKVLLREIFSRLVLQTTIDTCSKPEYINSWIVYFLEEGEPQLLNAIDAGLERASEDELKLRPRQPVSTGNYEMPNTHKPTIKTEVHPPFAETEKAAEITPTQQERLNKLTTASNSCETDMEMTSDFGPFNNGDPFGSALPEKTLTRYGLDGEQGKDVLVDTSNSSVSFENIIGNSDDGCSKRSEQTMHDYFPPPSIKGSVECPQDSHEIRTASQSVKLKGSAVSIVEDFNEGDKMTLKTKPTNEYLLQIEPNSSRHTGWMIARRYTDFEILHETLRRISIISGVNAFAEQHYELPRWKNNNKNDLRYALEKYLQHALRHEQLAECEGMKKFWEKGREAGLSPDVSTRSNFPFAAPAVFETVGKGMLGVFTTAPKGVASGGKAIVEGVSGIFGSPGSDIKRMPDDTTALSLKYSSDNHPHQSKNSFDCSNEKALNISNEKFEQPSPKSSAGARTTDEAIPDSSTAVNYNTNDSSTAEVAEKEFQTGRSLSHSSVSPLHSDNTKTDHQESGNAPDPNGQSEDPVMTENTENGVDSKSPRHTPLSEEETSIVVELLFAMINEVYGLSSAWNIRKKLLNAAKSFILRPGNPSLEAIRNLLQESVIDSNTSDQAIAGYLNKLREGCFPSEEELKSDRPSLSESEKDKLRVKARTLFVARGMPPALMGVMGASATGEALGRIFDCLQIESIGRGFVFAILLQALRVVIQ